ncbi:MAG: type I restriction enzyme endonuclease domain-containing protein [Kiritimatiellia bacterium]
MSQLKCLNSAAEFVQATEKQEQWYMYTVRRLKLAYDICCGSDAFSQSERDHIHFYLAIRSIIFGPLLTDITIVKMMTCGGRILLKTSPVRLWICSTPLLLRREWDIAMHMLEVGLQGISI